MTSNAPVKFGRGVFLSAAVDNRRRGCYAETVNVTAGERHLPG